MSNPLKNLAGQTLVYGLGTILPRLLNFLLTPLLTYSFSPSDFGINSEIFAYIAFLNIIFLYGMETTYFNFSAREENRDEVYNTAFSALITTTIVFALPLIIFAPQIADLLSTPNARYLPVYIIWSVLIIMTDALVAVPYAKLRSEGKAKKFSLLKIINITLNFALTVFFLVYCKRDHDQGRETFASSIYDPEIGIGYVFLAMLIANLFSMALLANYFVRLRFGFNRGLLRRMFHYTWPLIILGLAGNINDTADRIMIKWLIEDKAEAQNAQGIYGGCYKIAILMNIFIQAFRFAAEPFFFSRSRDKESRPMYALVMKYFIIFCLFIFLFTTLNLDWLKFIVDEDYRVGLKVVPILLIAYLCYGVMVNLSIWYKLSGQTKFGAMISVAGALITLAINFIFVPHYSFMACAWATLVAFASMMIMSYFLGQKYFPIKYNLRAIALYSGVAFVLYLISVGIGSLDAPSLRILLNNLLILLFGWLIYMFELNNLKKVKENVPADKSD